MDYCGLEYVVPLIQVFIYNDIQDNLFYGYRSNRSYKPKFSTNNDLSCDFCYSLKFSSLVCYITRNFHIYYRF